MKPQSSIRRSLQKGQAMIEYAIVAGALAAALFVADFNGRTGAQFLADAIKAFYRNLTYFISLP